MDYEGAIKSGSQSHIIENSDGYVYSGKLKELMATAVGLLQSQKGAFLAVVGEHSAGKSAFIAELLKNRANPAIRISAHEIKTYGVSQLTKLLRRAVQITFNELCKLVEGEVLEITSSKLTLKTVDVKSVFEIGTRMRQELDRERVEAGDVIRVYKDSGFITKLGRTVINSGENKNGLIPMVDMPEGECFKTETVSTVLSLDELDSINFTENGEELLFTETYVSKNIQTEVDKKVYTWIKEGKATCDKGVLIIDDSDALPESIFEILRSLKHSEYFPLVIMTSLFVSERIKQFLFVVSLKASTPEDVVNIISSRAKHLGITVDTPGMEALTDIYRKHGLKVSLQLMYISARSGAVSSGSVEAMLDI
ncbi:RuvB-like protein 2, partial [Pancytospora epiphaga]